MPAVCYIGKKGVESDGIDGQLIRLLFSDMTEIHRSSGATLDFKVQFLPDPD